MASSERLSKIFAQLASPSFQSEPIRRALMENVAVVHSEEADGWDSPTGTAIKTTFNADASTTVSNPPTQAQVQAINDRLLETRQILKALINSLIVD